MAIYSSHNAGLPGVQPSFRIDVDSEVLTWKSDPPGHDLPEPRPMYCTGGDHSINSGKWFEVFPGGRARFVRDGQ
jgi:hypothetical protein